MTAEFLEHFQAGMTANPDVEPELAKQAIAVINGKKSIRRTLILNALERRARQAGAEDQGVDIEAVDLSKIDWAKVLGIVLKILLLFLPFIMGS